MIVMSRFSLVSVIAMASTVAGCATTPAPVETRWRTVTVTKRGPCPDRATYERLRASRPTPLRNQARPRTGVERTARTAAQLGLYEGSGRWADQVQAVLDRCQAEGTESEESEGVADQP